MHQLQQGGPVVQDLGQWGRTAMGWFLGFKLHLHSNHQGQTMVFKVTGDTPDDCQVLEPMGAPWGARWLPIGDPAPSH